MSTEVPPVTPPATFSTQDTAARFAETFKSLPTEAEPTIPNGTDLAELAGQNLKNRPEVQKEEKKEVKDEVIPPELLGEDKPEQDEWEKLHTEEVKGHVKNENYKRYRDAAGKKISAIQAELERYKTEAEEYKSKLSSDFVPEKTAKELETLRKQLQEREELIGKKYVEESPLFREKFTQRQQNLTEQIKKAGEDFGVENVMDLIHMSPKKRVAAMEEVSPAAAGYLNSLLQQHDQVELDKNAYLSDWQSRRDEMEQQERAQSDSQKAKMKEHEDRVFNGIVDEISKTFAPLRKIEGNDQWNREREEIISQAKQMFDGDFTAESFAEVVVSGFGAKKLYTMYDRLLNLYRESKAEVESLRAVNPDMNGQLSKQTPTSDKNNTRWDRNDSNKTWREIIGAERANEL